MNRKCPYCEFHVDEPNDILGNAFVAKHIIEVHPEKAKEADEFDKSVDRLRNIAKSRSTRL